MFSKLAEKLNQKSRYEEEEIKFKDYDEESEGRSLSKSDGVSANLKASATENNSNIELKLARPEKFEEVADIADFLLDGCTVVLNLEALDKSQTLRMLDFLNGVTYTTGGDIKPVAQNTYIITPNYVDVNDEK